MAYRIPHVEGLESDRLTLGEYVDLTLRSLLPDATIRYTLDGTDPTATSPVYQGPLRVRARMTETRVTARVFGADGRVSAPRSAAFSRTMLRAPDDVAEGRLTAGLRATYSEVGLRSVAALDTVRALLRGNGIIQPFYLLPDPDLQPLVGDVRALLLYFYASLLNI